MGSKDKKESIIYITRGMKAKCDCGTAYDGQYLNIERSHGVLFGPDQEPVLNTNDHTTATIIGFGNCTSEKNSKYTNLKSSLEAATNMIPGAAAVKAATGRSVAELMIALGLVECKCEPDTPTAWRDGDTDNILDGAPILTQKSTLSCRLGGTITIMEKARNAPKAKNTASAAEEEVPMEDAVRALAADKECYEIVQSIANRPDIIALTKSQSESQQGIKSEAASYVSTQNAKVKESSAEQEDKKDSPEQASGKSEAASHVSIQNAKAKESSAEQEDKKDSPEQASGKSEAAASAILALSEKRQDEICRETGWSKDIVKFIQTEEQYEIYKNAGLHEAVIDGRRCLIKDIDMDYVDPKTNMTNRELLKKGRAPFAKNKNTGKYERIELHHMGQDFDAPFAELCRNEHRGKNSVEQTSNHVIMHRNLTEESWRRNKELKDKYNNEQRPGHWKARQDEDSIEQPTGNTETPQDAGIDSQSSRKNKKMK